MYACASVCPCVHVCMYRHMHVSICVCACTCGGSYKYAHICVMRSHCEVGVMCYEEFAVWGLCGECVHVQIVLHIYMYTW